MTDLEYYKEYRSDGRMRTEIRDLDIELSLSSYKNFNGSARLRQGLSEVIVFVEGPKEVW